MIRPSTLGYFAAAVVLGWTATAGLGADDQMARGKKLVETNCTRCHAVGATGDSPLTDAPPFREVALNYTPEELTDGFMEGLAVRHPSMPDWEMTFDQAQAITAYIMSLKPADAAGDGGTPEVQGLRLLQADCARCHAVEAEGDSPNPKAPPFREVVKRYDPAQLEEALAEGIVTGHNDMPEFEFEPAQIAVIVAYLRSLKTE